MEKNSVKLPKQVYRELKCYLIAAARQCILGSVSAIICLDSNSLDLSRRLSNSRDTS